MQKNFENVARELIRDEKKYAEDVIKYLTPLLSGPGADIINEYAAMLKGNLMVQLVNGTTESLKNEGTTYDAVAGEYRGIVHMSKALENLVAHARHILGDGENG